MSNNSSTKIEKLKIIKVHPLTKCILDSEGIYINKPQYLKYIVNEKQYTEIQKDKDKIIKMEKEILKNEKGNKPLEKEKKRVQINDVKNAVQDKINALLEKQSKSKKFLSFLKSSMIYLYENGSTLKQFMEGKSFQSVPYEEPYSDEFFELVKKGDVNAVALELSKNKKFLFSYDYLGHTPYHWACKLGLPDVLQILISYGRHFNQRDKNGRRPIHWAVLNNQYECAEILCKEGASCDVYDNQGISPLILAKDPKTINLIKNNINRKATTEFKWKLALSFVVKKENDRKKIKKDNE